MTTGDSLLAAVLASPDDDLPRLVYADWCEETGDAERAEFIRLQCACDRGTIDADGRVRERVLLQTHFARWLAPLRRTGEPLASRRCHPLFRRGFIEVVWMPAAWFVTHADQLFARCPVRELRVHFDHEREFALLAERHFAPLQTLVICDHRFGTTGAVELYRSRFVDGVRTLHLPGCNLDDRAAEVLADLRMTLADFDVRYNPLTHRGRGRLRARFGPAVRFE